MVYKFWHGWSHHLQRYCLLCQNSSNHAQHFGLCNECYDNLPHLQHACGRCALPLAVSRPLCGRCQQQLPAFDTCLCPLLYSAPLPNLISRLKKHHDGASIRLLAGLLASHLEQHQQGWPDVIITTPMYWRRNLQRGNNHSHLLAKQLQQILSLPYQPGLLRRVRATPDQKGLDAKARRHNLRGAFTVKGSVNGLHIAVVDDVITTTSTMQEMAKTLKAAGARQVDAWAIARTPAAGFA